MFKKIKASSVYQVLFVKALQESRQGVGFSYLIAGIIAFTVYLSFLSSFDEFPDPNDAAYQTV